jgi:hypothetical protein
MRLWFIPMSCAAVSIVCGFGGGSLRFTFLARHRPNKNECEEEREKKK